jgi:hypothetical protein
MVEDVTPLKLKLITYVDSPIEKYILQVQTVTHGNTPSHIVATANALRTKSKVKNRCWNSLLMRSNGGRDDGMSGA